MAVLTLIQVHKMPKKIQRSNHSTTQYSSFMWYT